MHLIRALRGLLILPRGIGLPRLLALLVAQLVRMLRGFLLLAHGVGLLHLLARLLRWLLPDFGGTLHSLLLAARVFLSLRGDLLFALLAAERLFRSARIFIRDCGLRLAGRGLHGVGLRRTPGFFGALRLRLKRLHRIRGALAARLRGHGDLRHFHHRLHGIRRRPRIDDRPGPLRRNGLAEQGRNLRRTRDAFRFAHGLHSPRRTRHGRIRIGLSWNAAEFLRPRRTRRCGRRREPHSLRAQLFPKLLLRRDIGHTAPAAIDLLRRDDFARLHRQRPDVRRPRDFRRKDRELISAQDLRRRVPVIVAHRAVLAHQPQRGNRAAAVLVDRHEIRTAAKDHRARVVVADVRDVHRALDDRHIPLARQQHRREERGAEIVRVAEAVVVRPDVVARIDPCAEARVLLPARLGRQRRPAHIVIARTPRNPRRSPLIFRHPHPALAAHMHPAPVVIRDAAPILVAHPSPARIRVSPVPIRIGRPIVADAGRTPAQAVVADFDPFAERRERIVKIIERDLDPGARRLGEDGSGQCGDDESEGEGFLFHSGFGK